MIGISNRERNDIENRSAKAQSQSRASRLIPNLVKKIKRHLEIDNQGDNDHREYSVDMKKEKKIIKEMGMAITFGVHIGFVSLGGGLGIVYQNPLENKKLITESQKIIDVFMNQKLFVYDQSAKKYLFGVFAYFLPSLFDEDSGAVHVYSRSIFIDIEYNIHDCPEHKLIRILEKLLEDEDLTNIRDFIPPYDIQILSFEEKLTLIPYLQKLGNLPSRSVIIELFNKILINGPWHIPKYKRYTSWIKARHIYDIASDSRYSTEHEIHLNFGTRCWTDHELIHGPIVMVNSTAFFNNTELRSIKKRLITPLYIHISSFRNTKNNFFRTYHDIPSNQIFLSIGNRTLKLFRTLDGQICDDQGFILTNDMNHISPYKTYILSSNLDHYINFLSNNCLLVVGGDSYDKPISSEAESIRHFEIISYLFPLVLDLMLTLIFYFFSLRRNLDIMSNYIRFIISPQLRMISMISDLIQLSIKREEPPSIAMAQSIRTRKAFLDINKFLYLELNTNFKRIVLYDEGLYKILRLQLSNPYRKISHNRRIIEFEGTQEMNQLEGPQNIISNQNREIFFLIKTHQNVRSTLLLFLLSIIPELVMISTISSSRFTISLDQKNVIFGMIASYMTLYTINTLLLLCAIKYRPIMDKLTIYLLQIHRSKLITYPSSLLQSGIYTLIIGLYKLFLKFYIIFTSLFVNSISLTIVFSFFFIDILTNIILVYISTRYRDNYSYLDINTHSI